MTKPTTRNRRGAAEDEATPAEATAPADATPSADEATASADEGDADGEYEGDGLSGWVAILSRARPGFRRGGIPHQPGVTRYPPDAFTADQIKAIEADPLFEVRRL